MIKSLIILSIIFNMIGLPSVSTKIDQSVIRAENTNIAQAKAASNASYSLPDILPVPSVALSAHDPNIYAKHYFLADPDSGIVFAKNNADTRIPIASTTKIMTATIALENYQLNDIVTVPKEATEQIPTVVNLRVGEQITVESLLNCMLINSGNDAAYAVGTHIGGDNAAGIPQFVEKMNEKAKELGMTDTHYQDPAGLNDNGYSTAHDLFIITRYALQNPIFDKIVKKSTETESSIDGKISHQLNNSNRLVNQYQYPGAIGVKTGFTDAAGHCLVGAAKRDGHTLIAIVLNTNSTAPSASADETKKLLDWGFANVDWGTNG